ncbi:MAG: hypothetical protein QOG54_1664 [Actinomycetota bacterium]|jgi:hypothetical protein|nr:hypothetical protein [Actinomycetota bacterium]
MAALVVVQTARAENPPSSFFPDEDGLDVSVGTILSDRDNGVDSLAHLTVVASLETERVEWYVCPLAVNDPVSQSQFASCSIIGVDFSPTLTGVEVTPSPPDEAYEMFLDVPAELDHQQRDLLALACTGAGTDIDGPDADCTQSNEAGVYFENSQSGAGAQTTTGRIISYCVADVNGPGTGTDTSADPCEFQPGPSPLPPEQQQAVAARFRPLRHGAAVPDNGFVLRASSSSDMLDGGQLRAARDFEADANRDPDDAEQDVPCSLIDEVSITWECVIPNEPLNADNNVEQAVWIYETAAIASGRGFCVGAACTLDSIYVASTPTANTRSAVASFTLDGAGCSDPVTELSAAPGEGIDVVGCLTDIFSGPASAPVTFETTGVGGFADCGSGVAHDHDGDGETDHCHGTTDSSGAMFGPTLASAFRLGTQTVVFCQDPENAASNPAAPPAGHGCADETDRITLTLHRVARPGHVHLVLLDAGAGDPCHTGGTSPNMRIGDTTRLMVCTHANEPHDPATTTQVKGGSLFWQLVPAGTPTVRFVGSPPTDTGPDATAEVVMEAVRTGITTVSVRLCDENGVCSLSEASVQFQVFGAETACADGVDNDADGVTDRTEDPGCTSYVDDSERGEQRREATKVRASLDGGGNSISGSVRSLDLRCVAKRSISILRQANGGDELVSRTRADRKGRFSAGLGRNPRGVVYAIAKKKSYLADFEAEVICAEGRSGNIRL